jgi:EAL and modified HD-GYP domain-containing signal transduction protein
MSPDEFLLIQPLLGPGESWSGYLVDTHGNSLARDEALRRLCDHPLLQEFDKRHPWLIPATPQIGICHTPLGERAIIMFPDQAPPSDMPEKFAELEAQLRQHHGKVGVIAHPGGKLPSTGAWDYLLINTGHARTLPPFAMHGLASRTVLVATDVLSQTDYAWLQDNACSLSTAEFLNTRNAPGKKADMTRVKLLKLLGLITNDADTSAMEEIFRQESKLSYSLLRLVNSAANAPRSPITSFAQAINMLGRRQLQRWLQLLVYADPNSGQHPNPLLPKAAARGRLIELLASRLNPRPELEVLEDAAFMAGAFSLLDVLLSMSMSDILKHLPLPAAIHEALAGHAGSLGALLNAVEAAERRDVPAACRILEKLGISPEVWLDCQLAALSWSARIHPGE